MKICQQALQDENLRSIHWNGAYFGNAIFGATASTVTSLFTPHHVAHEWIILKTTTNSFYCIQFAGSDSKKAEITMSYHTSLESANEAGMRVAGRQSYHIVQKERPTLSDIPIREFARVLQTYDENYNLITNNCQSLASKIYSKYAHITLDDTARSHQEAINTPGFSREIDGTITVTCQII